jgi:hypothetical protein
LAHELEVLVLAVPMLLSTLMCLTRWHSNLIRS